jgi:hypothetical protein
MPEQVPSESPVRPFDARMLDVGNGHWLYVGPGWKCLAERCADWISQDGA